MALGPGVEKNWRFRDGEDFEEDFESYEDETDSDASEEFEGFETTNEDESSEEISPRESIAAGLKGADDSNAGFIVRFANSLLKERERAILDFITAGEHYWLSGWIISGVFVLIGAGLTTYTNTPKWIGLTLVLIGAATGLPLMGGTWACLDLVPTGTKFMPVFAGFPVGSQEMAAVILKANLICCVCWLPW